MGTSRRRASSKASGAHSHQSTGFSACCNKYGLVEERSRFTTRALSPIVGGMTYDVDRLRSRMPALKSGVAYFDGPGGTQTPDLVAETMAATLTAGLSNRGTVTQSERNAEAVVAAARLAGADLLNADPSGIIFGRSMTELTFMAARTLAADWGPGDEVVVTRLDHDGNVRPWVTYANRVGATVRWLEFDLDTSELIVPDDAINSNTRLVAVTGASNVLGTKPNLTAIGDAAHAVDALFFVDGVHLTAHSPVDMQQIGADFFACSPYKFLGPHIGMLAASPALLDSLHPDKLRPSTEQVPERFELGTLPYELLAGVVVAIDMLADLVPGDESSLSRRQRLIRSMTELEHHEESLRQKMRDELSRIPGMTLYGNAADKTPTEFFAVDGVASADIYRGLAERGVNAPAGSFYAIEAADALGLGAAGAVRAGIAPYSNADDVDRLVQGVVEIAANR